MSAHQRLLVCGACWVVDATHGHNDNDNSWPYLFVRLEWYVVIGPLLVYIALALAAVMFMLLTRYRDPGIIPRGLEFAHDPGTLSASSRLGWPSSRGVAVVTSVMGDVVPWPRQSVGLRTQEAARNDQNQCSRRKPAHQILRYGVTSGRKVPTALIVVGAGRRQKPATSTDPHEQSTAAYATIVWNALTTTISFASSPSTLSLLCFVPFSCRSPPTIFWCSIP